MTKTEIVTALVAAQISKDYNGWRVIDIREYHVQESLRVAKMIIEASIEDNRSVVEKARQELGMIVEDCSR